jgi:hypothetical protein
MTTFLLAAILVVLLMQSRLFRQALLASLLFWALVVAACAEEQRARPLPPCPPKYERSPSTAAAFLTANPTACRHVKPQENRTTYTEIIVGLVLAFVTPPIALAAGAERPQPAGAGCPAGFSASAGVCVPLSGTKARAFPAMSGRIFAAKRPMR